MKKYFLKLAFVALCAGTLISCEEDTVTYGGNNFVSFDNVASTRVQFFENGGTSEVKVNLAFPKPNDVTVSFNVESALAVEGTDYVVLTPNNITIPAGETSASIKIQVIDNDVMDDSKPLFITLTGTNDATVTLGLKDNGSKNKRFLIVNNDCTTNFATFFGKLKVTASGSVLGTATATVNEDGDCNVLLIEGPLSSRYGLVTDEPLVFEFKPGNGANGANAGTITAYEQAFCIECMTDEGKQQNVLFKGSGSFVIGANTRLTINGSLYFANGTQIGDTSVILTLE